MNRREPRVVSTVNRARIARKRAERLGLRLKQSGTTFIVQDADGKILAHGELAPIDAYLVGRRTPQRGPRPKPPVPESASRPAPPGVVVPLRRCDASTLVGHEGIPPCRRAPLWRVAMHACRQVVLCDDHLQSWKHNQREAIYAGRALWCAHCGQRFERFEEACSITKLNDTPADRGGTPEVPRSHEAQDPEPPPAAPDADIAAQPEPYRAPHDVEAPTTGMHPLSYSLPGRWDAVIDDWVTRLAASGATPATRRMRRQIVRSFAHQLDAADPRDVTTAHLEEILGRPDYKQEYRRTMRASVRSFFSWAKEARVVETDPAAKLPVIRTAIPAPRPATDEVWRHILNHAPDEDTLLMARLACEAGLRRGEVAQVHADDLAETVEGWQLIVKGKGEKQRVVPIMAELAADIRAALPDGGHLFPGQIDGHLSPQRVGDLVAAAMPKGWSMHKLRHRYASRGFAATGNLRAVQEALGHSSVATTQRYTAVSSVDVRRVTEAAAWSDDE